MSNYVKNSLSLWGAVSMGTIVLAMLLTIFFDLSRIASLGVIFYIIMDIVGPLGNITTLTERNKCNTGYSDRCYCYGHCGAWCTFMD